MEFIDGVGVTDLQGLRRLGVGPREVSRLVAEVFNRMIFEFGDIHCDPHAANMLVRKQLVLLDHGLYKQISDKFRLEYAALWRSLIFADAEGIKLHSAAMNAGDAYPIFAAMLTQRPWEQIVEAHADHLRVERSPHTRQAAQDFMSKYARQISGLLQHMPRPLLLLLLKTNDCLRSVDHALGQPTNTLLITARECEAALGRERLRARPGIVTRFSVSWELAQVELRMSMFNAMVWLTWLRQLAGFWGTRQAKGNTLEDGRAPGGLAELAEPAAA